MNLKFGEFKKKLIETVLAKDMEQDIFMSGLDHGILELELIQCINYIRDGDLLKLMQLKKHIYQQWRIILDNSKVPFCGVLRKLIKRVQRAPNGQAGCERSNSKYARYKNKYSNRMGIEIIRSRARAGENGPPLPSFPAAKARQYWQDNNHRLAQKVQNSPSLTLVRRKREQSKKYTSRIFVDL